MNVRKAKEPVTSSPLVLYHPRLFKRRNDPTAASSYSYDVAGNDGKFKYDYSGGGHLIAFKVLATTLHVSPVAGCWQTETPSLRLEVFIPFTRHAVRSLPLTLNSLLHDRLARIRAS